MIAACPKCGARYRIDDRRLPPQGARLRCARCEAIFRVRGAGEVLAPASRAASTSEQPGASAPSAAKQGDLVLIADAEVESGRATAAALAAWGLRTILVHDGVEAILSIQRTLPRAVVIDAALPKMFGFQICELMKRNQSLRHIHVVLVGAIHDHERYRRPPSELYGADAYLERPGLPDGLRSILGGFGLALSEAPRPSDPERVGAHPERRPDPGPLVSGLGDPRPLAPRTARIREEPPPPEAPPSKAASLQRSPESSLPPAPDLDPADVEKAERLARIVVSDIVLYNAEKFEAAVAAGNVLDAMEAELQEGRGLFRQRIDARVRESRDFLEQELLRVARQRGGG